MTCFNKLGKFFLLHENRPSCLSISSLPNYKFHQIQHKFKKLGKYAFAQIRSCGLKTSACHLLPAFRHFGGKTHNISAHPRPMGVFCWAKWLEREAKAPTFVRRLPDFQSIEHVGTLEFQYHLSTPSYETLLKLPTVSAGFQAGELGEIHRNSLWAGQNTCEMVRKRQEDEKSHIEQLQKSACVSDQTNYFILVKKCGPESQLTQAILKQIRHKSYIHLELHFCTFLRPPRSYISELATAAFT